MILHKMVCEAVTVLSAFDFLLSSSFSRVGCAVGHCTVQQSGPCSSICDYSSSSSALIFFLSFCDTQSIPWVLLYDFSLVQGNIDHRRSSDTGGASRLLEGEENHERDSESIVVRDGIVFQVRIIYICGCIFL